jgi:hypothetical protein
MEKIAPTQSRLTINNARTPFRHQPSITKITVLADGLLLGEDVSDDKGAKTLRLGFCPLGARCIAGVDQRRTALEDKKSSLTVSLEKSIRAVQRWNSRAQVR